MSIIGSNGRAGGALGQRAAASEPGPDVVDFLTFNDSVAARLGHPVPRSGPVIEIRSSALADR
jgi:hypothetical protein